MKKLTALSSAVIAYLNLTSLALAQTIQIEAPKTAANTTAGYTNFSDFLNAAIRLAFIIALIAVLVMLIWGAIQWIFSGGSKEPLEAARNRIIHALVGLAILAVAFALVTLAGNFVGINLLGTFTIPSPGTPKPLLPAPS